MTHIARTALCRIFISAALVCAVTTATGTGCNKNHSPIAGESVSRWTCPMHPKVVSSVPRTCPLCRMNLVPAAAEPKGDGKADVGMPDAAF
jgi:hypothetical protein